MGRKARLAQLVIAIGGILLLWSLVLRPLLNRPGARATQPTASSPDSAGAVELPATPTMAVPNSASPIALPPLPAPGPPPTPAAPMLTLIDSFGGPAGALALKDDLLYVAEGSGLAVFNVADGRRPVRLNRIVLPGRVAAIQIVGERAYLASFDAGLVILDLSDPRAPRLAGTFATPGQGRDLQVVGNRVYLGQFDGPFQIIDVDDPAHPRLVGSYQPPASPVEVAVSGTRAYLAAGLAGLIILDLRDPASPALLGEYTGAPVIADVAARGDLVYLATTDGMAILDLANPDAPRPVGAFPVTGGAAAVLLDDQLALVAGHSGTVTMLDVSDPAAPSPIGRFGCAGCGFGFGHPLLIHEARAFMTPSTGGVEIVDLSIPATPHTLSAAPNSLRQAVGVQVVGATAFVAAGDEGLQIVDLGQPGGPVLLGGYDTPGHAYQVEVAGPVAYLADSSSVQIIDVRDPRAPRLLAAVTDVGALSLRLAGERLYIGGHLDGALAVIDVHDPANPRLLGATRIPFGGRVAVSGGHAFVAEDINGLAIYDVSDPAAIAQLGVYRGASGVDRELSATPHGVDVVGSTAYLATNTIGSAGLQIVDVGDPSRPRLLGYAPTYAEGHDVQVVDHVAYVAAGNDGVYAFDVRDPARPSLLRWYQTPDMAFDVEVAGERLYVAAGHAGLMVFWLGAGPAPTPLPAFVPPIDQATAASVAPSTVPVAGPAETFELLGAIDGATGTVALSGTLAYLGTSSGLTVLDLGDPTRPTVLGRLPQVTIDAPRPAELLIAGTQGYLADGYGGLAILDLTDPRRPALRGRYRLSSPPGGGEFKNPVNDVAVVGTYVYVAAGQSGLLILDIGTPAQPTLVGQIEVGPYAADVQVIGSRAYVAYAVPYSRMTNSRAGIAVVDVSNPAAPVLLGSYDMPDSAWANSLYVDGSRALLLSSHSQLRSFDVADPARITPLGALDLGGSASSLHVDGPLVYVLAGERGVQIFDMSDPTRPRRRGTFTLQEPGTMVRAAGGLALVSSRSGLTVLNVADPDAPQLVGRYDTAPAVRQLVENGGRVFIAGGDAGLRIFDLRDPARPLLVGSYSPPQLVEDVAVAGEHVFVATGDELRALELGNAQAPIPVSTYRLPGRAAAVELRDELAYVAIASSSPQQPAALVILNISDPARPALVGQVSLRPAMELSLHMAGARAFLLWPEGWAAVEVSDPAAPQLLGAFSERSARAIVVGDDLGYVLGDTLKVFDLRDGARPALIASYPIPATAMMLREQHLYLVGDGRLSVLDVGAPRSPREVGGYEGLELGSNITSAGDLIYVSSNMGGVRVLTRAP